MYEAVILDPWASWGVANRIAVLEMLRVEWCFEGPVEGGTEGALRRANRGARETDVEYLVEEGIRDVLTGGEHTLEGPDFTSD